MSDADVQTAIGWRQRLHAHPELLFDLPKTSAFVADRLEEFELDSVVRGIGGCGVVGVLHGLKPGGVTGLRADMDALPIQEQTGLRHASVTSGRMHACGHDGHMAMLLLAARRLSRTRDFSGVVVFIFQPAEENGGAGARAMLRDGLLERFAIEEVFGLHCMPNYSEGRFSTRSGGIMAAADSLRITVTGVGGHAARPETCVDPLLVASHIHIALQTIVARNIDPLASAVISITRVAASENEDTIAPTASMSGTVRTIDESVRDFCEHRIHNIAAGVAKSFGATAKVEYIRDYPVTVNHPAAVARATKAAARVSQVNADTPPLMVSEDFSFMLRERPGAFMFLGQGPGPGLHSSMFDFNDRILMIGADYWISLVRGDASHR